MTATSGSFLFPHTPLSLSLKGFAKLKESSVPCCSYKGWRKGIIPLYLSGTKSAVSKEETQNVGRGGPLGVSSEMRVRTRSWTNENIRLRSFDPTVEVGTADVHSSVGSPKWCFPSRGVSLVVSCRMTAAGQD